MQIYSSLNVYLHTLQKAIPHENNLFPIRKLVRYYPVSIGIAIKLKYICIYV